MSKLQYNHMKLSRYLVSMPSMVKMSNLPRGPEWREYPLSNG